MNNPQDIASLPISDVWSFQSMIERMTTGDAVFDKVTRKATYNVKMSPLICRKRTRNQRKGIQMMAQETKEPKVMTMEFFKFRFIKSRSSSRPIKNMKHVRKRNEKKM